MTDVPTMTSNRPYLLRAAHEWISDNGLTPYIVVDVSHPGVHVPASAVSDGRVVLNLSAHAVVHLDIGNEAINCVARFGGVSHPVEIPIAAVQAIYARENGQGMLLAPDAPGQQGDSKVSPDTNVGAAPLAPVPTPTGQDETGDVTGTPDSDKPPPKGKPTLRVIK